MSSPEAKRLAMKLNETIQQSRWASGPDICEALSIVLTAAICARTDDKEARRPIMVMCLSAIETAVEATGTLAEEITKPPAQRSPWSI